MTICNHDNRSYICNSFSDAQRFRLITTSVKLQWRLQNKFCVIVPSENNNVSDRRVIPRLHDEASSSCKRDINLTTDKVYNIIVCTDDQLVTCTPDMQASDTVVVGSSSSLPHQEVLSCIVGVAAHAAGKHQKSMPRIGRRCRGL